MKAKPFGYISATIAAVVLGIPLAASAQNTVFSDNFSNGSTLNGVSTPGGTPTASSTSYDIASTKAATTGPAISSGDLKLTVNAATTSGFVEGQAVFTSTPVTLATSGDYINMTYVFTDTGGTLLNANTSNGSYIWTGLYNSGGNTPVAGLLNNSGLSSTVAATYASGNAAGWQGYVGSLGVTAGSLYTRPSQIGGNSSADQELLGNNVGSGAYKFAGGTTLGGGTGPSGSYALSSGAVYTLSYQINYVSATSQSLTETLYSGSGSSLTQLYTLNENTSGATDLTSTFDSLAIGVRNSTATSVDPTMDISQITVTDSIASPTPEPGTLALMGGGAALTLLLRRRQAAK